MADEQISGSMVYEKVTTSEAPWEPSEQAVEVVLVPLPGDEQYYPPPAPSPINYVPPVEKAGCFVNIETTGDMPFDSRIISIAAADLRFPDAIMHFTGTDEELLVREFFDWFKFNVFDTLIAFNVAFDFRFLFVKAMKYQLQVPEFYALELYDLMEKMQNVQEKYVPGFNKPGKLDQWTDYFFGFHGPLTFEDVLAYWDIKQLDPIIEHNKVRIQQLELLYALLLYAQGEISL